MLENTFRKLSFNLTKFSVYYLFLLMKVFGICSLSLQPDFTFKKSRLGFVYSLAFGLVGASLFVLSVLKLKEDPKIGVFFHGVGAVTASMTYLISFVLIVAFYVSTVIKTDDSWSFLNRLKEAYSEFTWFYSGGYGLQSFDECSEDKFDEIKRVYSQLFLKVVICNTLTTGSLLYKSYWSSVNLKLNFFYLGMFFVFPYTIQSIASSFLFLGCRKTYFVYYRINKKMESMQNEVKLMNNSDRSCYERMALFCQLSDKIDDIGKCVEILFQMTTEVLNIYRVQLVMILVYTVFNALHELYYQYLTISYYYRGIIPYDYHSSIASMIYLVLNVLETLFIINTMEMSVLEYKRIAKNAHKIYLYLNNGSADCRLKQSLELLSLQLALNRLEDYEICGLHRLDFPLVIAVLDSVLSYLVIMIQFDLAYYT